MLPDRCDHWHRRKTTMQRRGLASTSFCLTMGTSTFSTDVVTGVASSWYGARSDDTHAAHTSSARWLRQLFISLVPSGAGTTCSCRATHMPPLALASSDSHTALLASRPPLSSASLLAVVEGPPVRSHECFAALDFFRSDRSARSSLALRACLAASVARKGCGGAGRSPQ